LSPLQHGIHGLHSLIQDHGNSDLAQTIDANKIAKTILDLQQADGTFVEVEGSQDEGTVSVIFPTVPLCVILSWNSKMFFDAYVYIHTHKYHGCMDRYVYLNNYVGYVYVCIHVSESPHMALVALRKSSHADEYIHWVHIMHASIHTLGAY
jgi:hypothetical protein